MKILMTGATGFVGTKLVKRLLDHGHELNVLTRSAEELPGVFKNPLVKTFVWADTNTPPPIESIQGIQGVINLMGENIAAKRWSIDQKKLLRSSRIDSTLRLTNLLNQNMRSPLEFFVSASAVGIYPVNSDETLTEESKAGKNFLAKLCKDWEESAHNIKLVKRVVIIRTAVVLESYGGALAKMLPPFRLGLGGPIGDGNHFMSWIHLDDLVNLYTLAVEDSSYEGVYNGAAPEPIDNFTFTKALGKALHRPTLIPVPATALKLAFGEMSSVILDSQKIVSERLKGKYDFHYKNIDSAMQEIFSK